MMTVAASTFRPETRYRVRIMLRCMISMALVCTTSLFSRRTNAGVHGLGHRHFLVRTIDANSLIWFGRCTCMVDVRQDIVLVAKLEVSLVLLRRCDAGGHHPSSATGMHCRVSYFQGGLPTMGISCGRFSHRPFVVNFEVEPLS